MFEYIAGTYSFNIGSTINSLQHIGEGSIASKLQEIRDLLPDDYDDLERDDKERVTGRLMNAAFDGASLENFQQSIYDISTENLYDHIMELKSSESP